MDILKQQIRHVPDFPKPGILFYDITTLLGSPEGFRQTVDALTAPFGLSNIEVVVGVESRGFILAAAVADRLRAGFVPVRKPGKLPAASLRESYNLEYGTDALEVHRDAVRPGQRVLLVDDVLATGGTARAACRLLRSLKADVVSTAFLIELGALQGRGALAGEQVFSVLQY